MRPIRLLRCGVIASIVVCILAIGALPAAANVGVGVDLGEIKIDEVLTPGNVYNLPTVGVINTGDRTADYEVVITYINGQQELTPSADWFSFEPEQFPLEPGTSKRVAPSLHVPKDASPGDYFALIEAHPVIEGSGGTTIAVGAATKLRFSVEEGAGPASVPHRIGSFFSEHALYFYIALGAIAVVVVVLLSRRLFRIRLNLERR